MNRHQFMTRAHRFHTSHISVQERKRTMRRTPHLWSMAAILCLVILAAGPADRGYTQDEVLPGSFFGMGARAMGMGGAFLGVADDYTALYWNPAGLAQIHRIELYGSLSHDRLQNKAGYNGIQTTDSRSKSRLHALGLAYPVPTERGSLVLGFGYNRTHSFDGLMTVASMLSASEQFEAWETESGGLGTYSLGGAIDVSPSVSLGTALDIWTGDDAYSWEYSVSRSQDPFSYRYLDTIDGDYSGLGLKFGALVRAHPSLRLGLTISSPVTFHIDEAWTQQTDTLASTYYDDGSFEYKMTTPYRFGFGGSFDLWPVRLAADVEYMDWSQTRYKEPHWLLSDNRIFEQFYREVYTYRLGAEYAIDRGNVMLRAGYGNDPLPVRNEGSFRDRDYLTVGAGFIVDSMFKIDVALVHGLWKTTDQGFTEKMQSDRVFLSMAYHF